MRPSLHPETRSLLTSPRIPPLYPQLYKGPLPNQYLHTLRLNRPYHQRERTEILGHQHNNLPAHYDPQSLNDIMRNKPDLEALARAVRSKRKSELK